MGGVFNRSSCDLLHKEKQRLNKGFLLHHTLEGICVWVKKRGGHCQPPSQRMRWGGVVLFSQQVSYSLLIFSTCPCPQSLSPNAALIHRQTNPLKPLPSHRNSLPPCPSLPANPSCLFFICILTNISRINNCTLQVFLRVLQKHLTLSHTQKCVSKLTSTYM